MQIERDNIETKRGSRFKIVRQAQMVKFIAIESARIQAVDRITCMISVAVGLSQALKYEGSVKRGINGGLLTYVVLVGTSVVSNVVYNLDEIKSV